MNETLESLLRNNTGIYNVVFYSWYSREATTKDPKEPTVTKDYKRSTCPFVLVKA